MQPTNNNGSIIIRFKKFGNKYSLTNLGKFDDDASLSTAKNICAAIQSDIDIGRFTATTNDELFTAYHPLADLAIANNQNHFIIDALSAVDAHLAKREYKDKVLEPVAALLKAYGKRIHSKDDAQKFFTWMSNDGKRSPNSNNRYLNALKPICPMFRNVELLKAVKTKKEKPFSKDEIKSIIEIFDRDYPHYATFIKFLFMTGCRTSEAVALTWDKVDFKARTVTIDASIGILSNGSKFQKSTKTDVPRVLSMSDKLDYLIKNQNWHINVNHDRGKPPQHNFVFPSPNGCLIDIGNFRARLWVKALESAKVPYRTLYNTRHTFVSHFIADNTVGDAFLKCASITHGTKSGVQTLIKHYAHLVNKVELPDMW